MDKNRRSADQLFFWKRRSKKILKRCAEKCTENIEGNVPGLGRNDSH